MPKSEDFVPELNPMVKVRNLTKAFAGALSSAILTWTLHEMSTLQSSGLVVLERLLS